MNPFSSRSPRSPESGYYASSPESNISMSPINQQVYNLNASPSHNTYDATSKIQLIWYKEPQNSFRFRYESEMNGTHGSLMGGDSSKEMKTFPTIQLLAPQSFLQRNPNIRIRCIAHQIDQSTFKPHSHKLVIKTGDSEKYDPHFVNASVDNGYKVEFKGMGIIHTAKKDIIKELRYKMIRLRESELGRPLNETEKKLERSKVPENIQKTMNLNQVCLCFEAFYYDQTENMWKKLCSPIFSKPINNISTYCLIRF